MYRWFVDLLYDSTPAEFCSAYGLSESVERLGAATKRWALFNLGETMAVGKVSENVVRLRRVIPMVHNSFQPIFTGHFEVRDGVTVLTGRFGMPMSVKVFMGFWLGMVILISGGMLLGGLKSEGPQATIFVWQPILMIGGGIALAAAGKWFARNDVAWLSGVIATALGTPRDGGAVTQGLLTNGDSDAVPMTLKVAAIVLGASGAMALVVGFTGPHVWPSVQPASDAPATVQLGYWNFVYALVVFSLSLGIWRRQPWAWWGGFVLLGVSVCLSLVAMPTDIHGGPPMGIKVIFAGFSCVVVAVWGCWWYAQRKHFLWG